VYFLFCLIPWVELASRAVGAGLHHLLAIWNHICGNYSASAFSENGCITHKNKGRRFCQGVAGLVFLG
jgi:hypothetical protein